MEGLGFGFPTPKESTASTQEEPQIAKSVHQLQLYFNIAEKGCGGEIEKSAFHQTCCGATALLLSLLGSSSRPNTTEKFSQQLVRLLCRCPAYIFSIDAMETGVYIWNWLVSDAPQLESLVLEELVDAWLWTVDTKRGLFANEMRYSGPAAKLRPHLAPGEPEILPDKDPVEEIVAHQLWLGFFTDRFEVSWHSSVEQLKLLGRLLQGTMKDPLQFSRHPNAAGTFFSVMLLGLKFCSWQCQANLQEFKMDYHLLQDQVYRASLGWFAKNPGWHETKIKNFAQNEVQSVLYFIHFLQNEHMDAIQLASSPTGRENKSENSLNDAAHHHPVWGKMDDYAAGKEKWKKLLLMLCHHEADRLDVWANPTKANKNKFYRLKFSSEKWIDYKFYRLKFSSEKWIEFARIAFSVDPQIALSLVSRFPAVSVLRAEVALLVQSRETETPNIPDTLPYLFTQKEVDGNYAIFQQLPYREACSIAQGLLFLSPAYKSSPHVKVYILKVLESYSPESVMHFVPQLVQALRYDDEGLVENYLVQAAQRSHIFSHKLIWVLQAELCSSESRKFTSTRKRDQYTLCCFSVMEQSCSFQARLRIVRQRITDGFTPEEHDLFQRESNFFDKITSISTVLFPHPKEERRAVIRRELEKIEMNGDDLYLPTAPGKLIRSIQLDSGTSLQSAAKVPIMITFNVVDRDGDEVDVKPQACIFKVGDDCRQDVLALQVISLLRDIFEAVEINLYLFPYGVLPTGPERGIIEVVPNARSRSQMGEINGGGLYEIFQHEFGPIGSPSFEAARSNFIRSSAGYAVASLLLQTKDRHNGNLLLDNVGRLVHIDFGFILGTSPGGNMRFENAQFKLSHEMTRLLDPSGSKKSETWMHFVSLCVKGYLAARLHMDEIINTVQMMVDSGLPCFSRADSISNLRQRFHPDMNEREAATFMIRICKDAYNKWTTALYDTIQYWQHGIKK